MISEKHINIIINTLKPFKPTKIGVFRSYSRGENTENSDIDILYSFNSKYNLFDLVGLQFELQEKLQKAVDLVEFTAIHPRLQNRILNEAKIIYKA